MTRNESNSSSPVNQKIAIKTIQKLGFSANAVWNGKEALDYLLAGPTPTTPKPDVILMDCQMPVLDGYRATHLIRHHSPFSAVPSIRTLPIIAMTASAIQGDREKCTSAGMDDYLAKPVKGKLLEDMLLKWAAEGRRKSRLGTPIGQKHTDHDSICTAPSSAHHSGDSAETPSDGSSENSKRARVRLLLSRFPSMESADEESLQNTKSEEHANALGDERLPAASETRPNRLHIPIPRNDPISRPSGPVTPLTFENVSLLSRELETNPFELHISHDSEYCDGESVADSFEGSPLLIGESPMTAAKEYSDMVQLSIRARLARNESSIETMTQKSFRE